MLIQGDGVGPELQSEMEKLFTAIGSFSEFDFNLNLIDINEDHFRETGLLIPSQLKQVCENADVIWLGPISDNSTLRNYSESAVINKICQELHLDLHIKRLSPLNSLQTIQSDNILDILIMQNQFSLKTVQGDQPILSSDGEYIDIYNALYFQESISKLYQYAADLPESKKHGKIMLTLPEELFHEKSPWMKELEIFSEKNIKIQILTLDKLFFQILHNPENLGVIITSPPFGQILSRMGAALEGGLGVSYDYYQTINSKKALFHVLHPASKRFVGKDAANPIGAILCLGEMMQFFKYPGINSVIREIVEESVMAGWTTRDLGGSMGTCEIGDFICSKLSDKLDSK